MRTWFTSDLHFGHELVAGHRGFPTSTYHDAVIANNWHRCVGPKDTVWVLGDLTMNNHRLALAILAGLPGHKHLVAGNHDKVSPIHRNAGKHQREYLEVFESVQAYAKIRVERQEILLSHYPYATDDGEADRGEVRYQQWRLPDEGRWLLHGHTHMADQVRHGRQIHVGLDAHQLEPVELNEIVELMKGVEV